MEKDFINNITNFLQTHDATDVAIYDIQGKSKLTNFLILATTKGELESRALSKELEANFPDLKLAVEGEFPGDWIVLDFGEFVIELFNEETRKKYNLEKLWGDSHNSLSTQTDNENVVKENDSTNE